MYTLQALLHLVCQWGIKERACAWWYIGVLVLARRRACVWWCAGAVVCRCWRTGGVRWCADLQVLRRRACVGWCACVKVLMRTRACVWWCVGL